MSEGKVNESADRGMGFWIMMMVGVVLFLYLLSFTVLCFSPQAARAAQALGLTEAMLDKIYYPILRFVR